MSKHNYNYHGHTYLCGHAGGAPKDYVLEAIKHNFKYLGISEHAPMPFLGGTTSRLDEKDYDLYLNLMKEAKILGSKHGLTVLTGFETEYFLKEDQNGRYKRYLNDVEYLILGQHYIYRDNKFKSSFALDDLTDVKIYADTVVKALETGYYSVLAHPELCFFNIENPTDEMFETLRPIIKTAKRLDIPLEINANGIRRSAVEENNYDPLKFKYPKLQFLKMVKEENTKVLIGSDCHSVDALNDFAIDESYKLIEQFGLDYVTEIKINYYK